MPKTLDSIKPSNFSPAITNQQAGTEVIDAGQSQDVTVGDRVAALSEHCVINLSTNHLHIQPQPQHLPQAIARQNWNIQPHSHT